MYDLENFHGKWMTFAAEDRILFCCPSVGTEYSDMKLCLLHDVDKQRQGNIKRQKVYMLKCCLFNSTLTVVCSYLFYNCKYLLILFIVNKKSIIL